MCVSVPLPSLWGVCVHSVGISSINGVSTLWFVLQHLELLGQVAALGKLEGLKSNPSPRILGFRFTVMPWPDRTGERWERLERIPKLGLVVWGLPGCRSSKEGG